VTVSSLRTAIQEAERFSELAKALLELRHTALGGDTEYLPTGKLSGTQISHTETDRAAGEDSGGSAPDDDGGDPPLTGSSVPREGGVR
jgi:hypothetical protein